MIEERPKRVLVTGATGMLGRPLTAELASRGHQVVALSRRPHPGSEVVEAVAADVLEAGSLVAPMVNVDVVVHAATSWRRRARVTEVEGTRSIVAAAERTSTPLIYVSIVGVDDHRFPYYRAKREAEQVVENMKGEWAIQRATQFHELLDLALGLLVFPRTRHLVFQVCDPRDVAVRLVDALEKRTTGKLPDFGGPELVPIHHLREGRRVLRGRASTLVPTPSVGFMRDFDTGVHTTPAHRDGTITWSQWCNEQSSSIG